MPLIKRIVLDVLKPHHPNALNFSKTIAGHKSCRKVHLVVSEMDEKTESVIISIEGDDIDYESIEKSISGMGGSVHSIDEVEVISSPPEGCEQDM